MRHEFMERISRALAERRVATLRFQFPYMESRSSGSRRPPDRAPVLEAAVRAAVARGRRLARGIPLIAGGKSMGGRMTSQAAAQRRLRGVDGIVFLGFPLHPAGREEKARARAAHLATVDVPMLFLQGTRDALAEMGRMRRVVRRLGASAELHTVREADHAFAVRVRSGRTEADVIAECADAIVGFVAAAAV